MKKKNVFFITLLLGLSISTTAGSINLSNNFDDNGLRIFTPYHKVKQVFNTIEQETASSSESKMQLTQEEIDLMAQIVYAESKGEPFIGKVGVASVILNRLHHPDFPKSVEGVIYQKNAFSCVNDGIEDDIPDTESYNAVVEALNGNDPTDDSLYFYNPKYSTSEWIKNCPKKDTIKIGNHIFFK